MEYNVKQHRLDWRYFEIWIWDYKYTFVFVGDTSILISQVLWMLKCKI